MAAAPLPPAGRGAFSGVPYDEIPFKELQRLHARRMEFFGFGGWLASTLFYGPFVLDLPLPWRFLSPPPTP